MAKRLGRGNTGEWDIDGSFPGRGSEPTIENLGAWLNVVKTETGADFGVAFDGDGDRSHIL